MRVEGGGAADPWALANPALPELRIAAELHRRSADCQCFWMKKGALVIGGRVVFRLDLIRGFGFDFGGFDRPRMGRETTLFMVVGV